MMATNRGPILVFGLKKPRIKSTHKGEKIEEIKIKSVYPVVLYVVPYCVLLAVGILVYLGAVVNISEKNTKL